MSEAGAGTPVATSLDDPPLGADGADGGTGAGGVGAPTGAQPPAQPRRPRRIFLVVGLVLAVGLAIGLFTGVGTHSSGGRPGAGSAAPTFSVPRLGGGASVGVPIDGGGHGRPAVLLFFASWCVPCQKEIPALAATYRRQQAEHTRLARVALVGVDGDDGTADAKTFVHHAGVTFPVGVDHRYTVTEGLFYFTGLPEAVFVNGDGSIAAIHYGALSSDQLVRWQQRLLTAG
jgi:thiol-disulfide isomerase/thioredoxin